MLLKKYDPQWKIDFHKIKQELQQSLKGIEIKIEHVGSTSVMDLAAKPIIDIDIIYYQIAKFVDVKKRLEKLGYFHNGNQGIEGREVFNRPYLNIRNEILDNISHHLYVCLNNSNELQRHLDFRNYLRNNQSARKQYEKIKYSISYEAGHDKTIYAKLKEIEAKAFIEQILEIENHRKNPKS
jgi:GrpB-like predicted nucleotidyltransferase (UPF0157 family)